MKHPQDIVPTLLAAMVAAFPLAAQERLQQQARLPDIELDASVTAESVEFHDAPQVKVRFQGGPFRITADPSQRQGLPTPVAPGRRYDNIGASIHVTSTFDVHAVLQALSERTGEPQPTTEEPSP